MSLKDCVNRAVAAGEMDRARAERILAEYDNVFPEFQRNMGFTQAEAEAARYVLAAAKREAFEKRRVAQLQAAATERQLQRLATHRNVKGDMDAGQYLMDLVSLKRGSGGATLAGQYSAVQRYLKRDFTKAMETFRANLAGVRRNRDTLNNLVREVFGTKTGDAPAAGMALDWLRIAEKARTRFNAAGGHIGKLADWGLPQAHNRRKVANAGFRVWADEIRERLDWEGMAERWNSGLTYSPEKQELLLNEAWEAIRTDGYSKRKPSANAGRGATRNQRSDPRFFKFKTPDDWLAYNERFGSGKDAFRVMSAHLDSMAMDIAMMEELGPNPMNTFAYLQDAARDVASRSSDPKALDRATRKTDFAGVMLDTFQGRTNVPHSDRAAIIGANIRSFLSSAMLGRAVISSVTDFNTQQLTAGFAGMSRTGFLKQMFRLISSKEMRRVASEAGLIFENAVDVGNAVARHEMQEIPTEITSRLADGVIRSSGLGWLTEIHRQSFGLEFMSMAAKDWVGKSFADLNPKTQRMFEGYGIGARDWEAIRGATIFETQNGVKLLRAEEIEAAAGQRIADRYMEAITSMTEFAVPTSDIAANAFFKFNTKPGSLPGELVRFGFQFKSFPATIMVTQIGRIMNENQRSGIGSASRYAAGLLIGNTLLGGVAIQMKELSKGRDPRDMTTAKFWAAAIAQGGGLGIFGDFFFTDANRFGGGLGETLGGPGLQLVDDVFKLTVGNAQQALAGDDTNMAGEAIGMMQRYTPGGSLWFAGAAYQREVLDQLRVMSDPQAARSFRRKIRSAQDFDTEFFFPPGASVLQGKGRIRAPNLKNAVGE